MATLGIPNRIPIHPNLVDIDEIVAQIQRESIGRINATLHRFPELRDNTGAIRSERDFA